MAEWTLPIYTLVHKCLSNDSVTIAKMPKAFPYTINGSVWCSINQDGLLQGGAITIFIHDFYAILRQTVDAMIISHSMEPEISVHFIDPLSLETITY